MSLRNLTKFNQGILPERLPSDVSTGSLWAQLAFSNHLGFWNTHPPQRFVPTSLRLPRSQFFVSKAFRLKVTAKRGGKGSGRLKKVPLFEYEVPCCYKRRVNVAGTEASAVKR